MLKLPHLSSGSCQQDHNDKDNTFTLQKQSTHSSRYDIRSVLDGTRANHVFILLAKELVQGPVVACTYTQTSAACCCTAWHAVVDLE